VYQVASSRICLPLWKPIVDFQNDIRVSLSGLAYGVLPAASSKVVIRSVAFPVLLVVSALLRGSCGARRRRSFCFAPAPFRFWLPRPGPPRKAASGLGSRAHSLSGARDNGQNKEKRMYLNRITLIGFIGSDGACQ
jgi:hypothetical protein